ncbi:MAG: hypothetical protein JXA14_22935 [Anaerolineae bacterium]|nr:hypothetical protein [Anaerolineae bacterium]
MKQAFFVVGPESSGTRLLTRVLIRSGCFGDDGHRQRMDDLVFYGRPSHIAFRRSVPHDGGWPDLARIVRLMRQAGYDVTALVTVRELQAMAKSQVRAGHVRTISTALGNIERAYRSIFAGLGKLYGTGLFVVPYEAAVLHPPSLADLVMSLGLTPASPLTAIYDGNAKHYQRPP